MRARWEASSSSSDALALEELLQHALQTRSEAHARAGSAPPDAQEARCVAARTNRTPSTEAWTEGSKRWDDPSRPVRTFQKLPFGAFLGPDEGCMTDTCSSGAHSRSHHAMAKQSAGVRGGRRDLPGLLHASLADVDACTVQARRRGRP
eukprot:scaffold2048_cov318-Pavlova_lutheri.AAC.5